MSLKLLHCVRSLPPLLCLALSTAALAAPQNVWLANPNHSWELVSSGHQYVSSQGPTFSHLHNGTTPNANINTVQKQVFNPSVGPSSLNQTTTLGLANFSQQAYAPGSALLGNLFWAPTSATLALEAFYGANEVGVEFIGGTSGDRTSFNVLYQQELNWNAAAYGISSADNTLRSYTWIEDYDGGPGSYVARFGYSNTSGASPALHFQRAETAGGVIGQGTYTYVMQEGTIVRNPTVGPFDNQNTISSDNPGNAAGPGRTQSYNIPLSSLVLDGSTLNIDFFSSVLVDISRNWGDADGRFHANPSFNVLATLTVNYDTYAVVPEPSTGLLLGIGAVLLSSVRRKRCVQCV